MDLLLIVGALRRVKIWKVICDEMPFFKKHSIVLVNGSNLTEVKCVPSFLNHVEL